jgi:hypothetical protein
VREITLIAAGVTLVFGVFVNWLRYPRVTLTIYNESSAAISDVHISFMSGERTAERFERGGLAYTEIESGGSGEISISYRHSGGILRKDERVYQSRDDTASLDRGSLEVHITNQGIRVVKSLYNAIDIPIVTVPISPRGAMTVK